MFLKQSFFDSNWVLQVILWLTVSNCASGSSNFDTAFCLTVRKFVKQLFSYSKWVT